MAENIVTVSSAFGAGAEGNYLFAASGTLMSSTNVAIVTPVVRGVLDSNGNLLDGDTGLSNALLLASDNFATGQLNWNFFLQIQGLPVVNVFDVPVLYSNGASQQLFTILAAAGWVPTST
jgi:hypothetical protein